MKKHVIFILWTSVTLSPLCATMKDGYARIQRKSNILSKPIFQINSFHSKSILLHETPDDINFFFENETIKTLGSSSDIWRCPDLILNNNGYPSISYETSGHLKIVSCDGILEKRYKGWYGVWVRFTDAIGYTDAE